MARAMIVLILAFYAGNYAQADWMSVVYTSDERLEAYAIKCSNRRRNAEHSLRTTFHLINITTNTYSTITTTNFVRIMHFA